MFKPTVRAKPYWKHFIFAWALPPLVLSGIVLSGYLQLSKQALWLILVILVAGCYFLASKPMRDGRLTWGECFWWIGVVPVLIWFAVMGSATALIFLFA
jgi:hypothetical protein